MRPAWWVPAGLAVAVATVGAAPAPDTALAPLPPEAQQRLERMIGAWESRWDYVDADGHVTRSVRGTETARYLIGNRVVEMVTDIPSLRTPARAWLFYGQDDRLFHLASVDENGEFWLLSGGLDRYVITSAPKRHADGSSTTIRFAHKDLGPDSTHVLMEYSENGGATWEVGFHQYLVRIKS